MGYYTAAQQAALYYARKRRRLAQDFDPLSLSPSAWYDPSDLSTLFQDSAGTTPVAADGDPVGLVQDKSGNGRHLSQTTAASRPLYKTSGGLHWLEGDGIDDWLRATFAISQPWGRLSALRQVSWALGDRIVGGGNADSGIIFQSNPGSPNIGIYSGSILGNVAPAIGQDFVLTERTNGASSRIALNNEAYVTGNAGATVPGGITLFADSAGGRAANARCYGLFMREGQMTDAQIAQMRTWMGAKAGLSL